MNDGNLLQLPIVKMPQVCVAALGSSDQTEAGAAVKLLCTATTNDDVRKIVSKHLGTEQGISDMIKLLGAASATVQVCI